MVGSVLYDELFDDAIAHEFIIEMSQAEWDGVWGDTSRRPLIDKILAVEEYRARYLQYLGEYVDPERRLFVFDEYRAKFDQVQALYGNKAENDTADPDPMGFAGYEEKYFADKIASVLPQLGAAQPE